MAIHAVQQVTPFDSVVAYAAANAGGDKYPGDDYAVGHIRNTSGVAVTLTPDSKAGCSAAGTDHDTPPIVVDAGAERYFGPLRRARYADPSGYINFTTTTQAGVTLAFIRCAPVTP